MGEHAPGHHFPSSKHDVLQGLLQVHRSALSLLYGRLWILQRLKSKLEDLRRIRYPEP